MNLFASFVENIFTPLYQLVLGVFFLYFLGAAMFYIWQMNKEEARTNAKQHLLWGTIGLFIMFSVGGILQFLNKALGGVFGL